MKKLSLISLISFIGLISPIGALATDEARLYVELEGFQTEAAGDFSARILVDSAVPLNAYAVVLQYPSGLLELTKASLANSVIGVLPDQILTEPAGQVIIEGGSTMPFMGQGGLLATLEFKPLKTGSGEIGFSSAVVYLADGKGTRLMPAAFYVPIEIASLSSDEHGSGEPMNTDSAQNDSSVVSTETDNVPPIIASFRIEKNPFDESMALAIFDAQDESGIAYFLMQKKQWLFFPEAIKVVNPESIGSGVWAVKLIAVDAYGNETAEVIYRFGPLAVKIIFALIIIGALWLIRYFYRRWRQNQQSAIG